MARFMRDFARQIPGCGWLGSGFMVGVYGQRPRPFRMRPEARAPFADRSARLRQVRAWRCALRWCARRECFPARSERACPSSFANAGTSVVYATTDVANPSSASNRIAGMHRISRASARPATASLIARRTGSGSPTRRMAISAMAASGMTLGARPPEMTPMLSVQGPSSASVGSRIAPHLLQRIQQLFDRRLAQLGISRMSQLPARLDLVAQHALARQRQLVFRGLAVDQIARAARIPRGRVGPGAVALLAHDEKQSEIADSGFEQALRRCRSSTR